MTVDELRSIVEEQSGFKLNKLMTTTGKVATTTREMFSTDPVKYEGLAKISGAPVKMYWELEQREDGWYYSSTPI